MQSKQDFNYSQKLFNSNNEILTDLIEFQNERLKYEFKTLLFDSNYDSNKKNIRYVKRSSNCSNKNGNLGNKPFFLPTSYHVSFDYVTKQANSMTIFFRYVMLDKYSRMINKC